MILLYKAQTNFKIIRYTEKRDLIKQINKMLQDFLDIFFNRKFKFGFENAKKKKKKKKDCHL